MFLLIFLQMGRHTIKGSVLYAGLSIHITVIALSRDRLEAVTLIATSSHSALIFMSKCHYPVEGIKAL